MGYFDKEQEMWDKIRGGNSFDPSIADNNNKNVSKTVITEDADGNKVTTKHENKTTADLMKKEEERKNEYMKAQSEAIDPTTTHPNYMLSGEGVSGYDSNNMTSVPSSLFDDFRNSIDYKTSGTIPPDAIGPVTDKGFVPDYSKTEAFEGNGLGPGNLIGGLVSGYNPTTELGPIGTTYSGGATQAFDGRVPVGDSKYTNDARRLFGDYAIGPNDAPMIDTTIPESIGTTYSGGATQSRQGPFSDSLTLDLPGTSIGDQLRAARKRDDILDAVDAGVISQEKGDKSISKVGTDLVVKQEQDVVDLEKQRANSLNQAKHREKQEVRDQKLKDISDAEANGVISEKEAEDIKASLQPMPVKPSIFDDTLSATNKKEDTITDEVSAKTEIDKKENVKAKTELNKWLDEIQDPSVSKEQAQVSAEAMITSATAGVPKKEGSKLKKALLIAAGSMLFGSSFKEALGMGLGAVGADVEAENKIKAEQAKQATKFAYDVALDRAKNGNKDGPEFNTKPQYVNIGTYAKPIKASLTQAKDGQLYIRYNGVTRAVGTKEYSDWYTPKDQEESFRKNSDSIKKLVVGSLKETIGDRDNKEWNQTYSTALNAAAQTSGALNVYKDAGINVETGMLSHTKEAIEKAVLEFAMYKHKIPNGKKSLREFASDQLVVSSMGQQVRQKDGSYRELPAEAWVLPSQTSVEFKVGDMPDKAYADTQTGLNRYIHDQSNTLDTKALYNMSNAGKMLLAYQAFESIKDKEPNQTAIEAGYTPFMWWLTNQRK